MIRAVSSLIILTLVLTGVALGAARGQAQIDGRVVVCSGQLISTVMLDQDGRPVDGPHFCPDMALTLLSAVGGGADLVLAQQAQRNAIYHNRTLSVQTRAVPVGKARGPPLWG